MTEQEFPGGTVDQGSSIVTTVALVAAMMQVGSMAQELPNAVGVAKKKKKEKRKRKKKEKKKKSKHFYFQNKLLC